MSDNRDYMTLHLQTFSLSVRFFLKLSYTLIRKKKTRSKHLCPRIPNEALSGSSSACDKHDAHETYYLIQSTRPARHSIPFGVDRNSVTRNTGEKRRIARNAWPRRRGHDRVIAPWNVSNSRVSAERRVRLDKSGTARRFKGKSFSIRPERTVSSPRARNALANPLHLHPDNQCLEHAGNRVSLSPFDRKQTSVHFRIGWIRFNAGFFSRKVSKRSYRA